MKPEYRLAHLMRGVWTEHEDTHLLARVAEFLDGLTADAITHSPGRVVARFVQHPKIAFRLLTNPGMRNRLREAYTDTWEYEATDS
jgi:digeranylgeranylglycerophospholipid reductase